METENWRSAEAHMKYQLFVTHYQESPGEQGTDFPNWHCYSVM